MVLFDGAFCFTRIVSSLADFFLGASDEGMTSHMASSQAPLGFSFRKSRKNTNNPKTTARPLRKAQNNNITKQKNYLGVTKGCYLEVFKYLKPSKKHSIKTKVDLFLWFKSLKGKQLGGSVKDLKNSWFLESQGYKCSFPENRRLRVEASWRASWRAACGWLGWSDGIHVLSRKTNAKNKPQKTTKKTNKNNYMFKNQKN